MITYVVTAPSSLPGIYRSMKELKYEYETACMLNGYFSRRAFSSSVRKMSSLMRAHLSVSQDLEVNDNKWFSILQIFTIKEQASHFNAEKVSSSEITLLLPILWNLGFSPIKNVDFKYLLFQHTLDLRLWIPFKDEKAKIYGAKADQGSEHMASRDSPHLCA